jgi:L-asparaginase
MDRVYQNARVRRPENDHGSPIPGDTGPVADIPPPPQSRESPAGGPAARRHTVAAMRHVTLITTGGTIEKTFDESTGKLENRWSVVRRMVSRLRLEDTAVNILELMSKDSLTMNDDDRRRVVEAVKACGGTHDLATETQGIVILHGTDTLALTGEHLHASIPAPRVPIVLTGAMRPYELKRSDSIQNLTEAIFAAGTLPPGVYCVAHGRSLKFPGVVKDRERGTFVLSP